jgi:parvulin-like peptidyl-prolyl isomerase
MRKDLRRVLLRPIAALILALGVSSCKKKQEGIVARVGKSTISEAEFRRKLSEVAPDYQNYVLTPLGRRQFLDVLIREKLILEAARSDGVAASPEFKEQMAQLKKEEEEKLLEARDYLLARLWFDELRRKGIMKISDQEVQDYHKKYPNEVRVRHILLAAAEEAVEVLKKIRDGANFSTIAKNLSLDADTATQGGQMQPALFGEIIPELEVVFKMRVGETAGPVRSKFGYHVLLKEGERALAFGAAEERIRNILEKQKLDRHLQSLQGSYPVEVFDVQFR